MNVPAKITHYMNDGFVYELQSPLPAQVLNMSKSGLRLKMKEKSLLEEDFVSVFFEEKGSNINAEVKNSVDLEDSSEYGCQFKL